MKTFNQKFTYVDFEVTDRIVLILTNRRPIFREMVSTHVIVLKY